MASKKKKKLPDGEAKKAILSYITKQNRPVNATLMAASLHGQCSKPQCQKHLEKLTEEGKLDLKVNGKQKIYFPPQEGLECVDSETLAEMDKELEDKKKEVKALDGSIQSQASEMKSLDAALSNDELDARAEHLTSSNAALEEEIVKLKEFADGVNPEDIAKLTAIVDKCRTEWRKRKRICKEIVDTLTEQTMQKPAVLMEELGLETDEELNVNIADLGEPPQKKRKLR